MKEEKPKFQYCAKCKRKTGKHETCNCDAGKITAESVVEMHYIEGGTVTDLQNAIHEDGYRMCKDTIVKAIQASETMITAKQAVDKRIDKAIEFVKSNGKYLDPTEIQKRFDIPLKVSVRIAMNGNNFDYCRQPPESSELPFLQQDVGIYLSIMRKPVLERNRDDVFELIRITPNMKKHKDLILKTWGIII